MAKHDSDLDRIFCALGDPTRRAIFARLSRGPASVSELAGPHDIALPTFLGHLKKLEMSGLVETSKKGRVRVCRVSPEAFAPAQSWLDDQRRLWETRLEQFDDFAINLAKDRQL
jgi:DNA-binding transcriptional ArsR family regulator